MLGDIMAARGEGNYLKYLQKLTKVNLLIIDDFGLNSLTDTDKKDLMEIIEDRYMTGSTIIASQLPTKDWHAFIGDPTIADAVCDRLFHVAHKFELKGDSMRKKLENID
jgi:DNA replication protein DnaC